MHMPDVKIEWNAGRTQDQKDKVAKAITDALVEIAKAPRENVKISFKDNPV
jgi:phenylpyruvate tautomerase PptA (4-oxalocrotonate tautomerase family)